MVASRDTLTGTDGWGGLGLGLLFLLLLDLGSLAMLMVVKESS